MVYICERCDETFTTVEAADRHEHHNSGHTTNAPTCTCATVTGAHRGDCPRCPEEYRMEICKGCGKSRFHSSHVKEGILTPCEPPILM